MRVLDLFSGIGGFSLGLERAGMETIAFCEIDPFCQKVLRKHWSNVPIYEDIKALAYTAGVRCDWNQSVNGGAISGKDKRGGCANLREAVHSEEEIERFTEEQLTLFAEDSHASPSLMPGSEQARKMTVISGRKCVESFLRFSQLGCLARMLLESSAWSSTRCYLTWKHSATPQGRLLFRLVPSMPRTEGIESGLLATPTETANQLCPSMQKWPSCAMWPTPNSADHLANQSEQINAWEERAKQKKEKKINLQFALRHAVQIYPIPAARDYRGGATPERTERMRKESSRGLDLPSFVRNEGELSGSLNPQWVEWLMGYPVGYTDCEHSETQSSPKSSKSSEGQ